MLARPILQEYDAFTVVELVVNPAEFGNLAARHNLVQIVEARRREADACTMDGFAIATVEARLLARLIL